MSIPAVFMLTFPATFMIVKLSRRYFPGQWGFSHGQWTLCFPFLHFPLNAYIHLLSNSLGKAFPDPGFLPPFVPKTPPQHRRAS